MTNGREMLMGNEVYSHEYLNIDELVQKADRAKHSGFKFTYLYKCKVDRKDSVIYCRIPNNIWIKNEPYDPADFPDIQVGDSILFTGTLARWENDTTIKMIYCIPIPVSKYPFNVK